MSGGCMDYISYKMEDVTKRIPDVEIRALWKDLSELMHDIEWYLSGDYGYTDYEKAVIAFKNKWFKTERIELLKQILDERIEEFKKEILIKASEDAE